MKMKKYLISFGLVWIIIWCFIGLYHGAIHQSYADKMARFAAEGNLLDYWNSWKQWKWQSIVHSHGISFSFMALFLGLVWEDIRLKDRLKTVMGVMTMLGIVMAGVFGTLDMLVPDAIGDLLLLGGFVTLTFGYVRGIGKS